MSRAVLRFPISFTACRKRYIQFDNIAAEITTYTILGVSYDDYSIISLRLQYPLIKQYTLNPIIDPTII